MSLTNYNLNVIIRCRNMHYRFQFIPKDRIISIFIPSVFVFLILDRVYCYNFKTRVIFAKLLCPHIMLPKLKYNFSYSYV